MSEKTFITLFTIAQIIFITGIVLSCIGIFGQNHPTAEHLGVIISCFGSLCILLVSIVKRKRDKNNSEKTNS